LKPKETYSALAASIDGTNVAVFNGSQNPRNLTHALILHAKLKKWNSEAATVPSVIRWAIFSSFSLTFLPKSCIMPPYLPQMANLHGGAKREFSQLNPIPNNPPSSIKNRESSYLRAYKALRFLSRILYKFALFVQNKPNLHKP
jgi:hypothetical protein